MQLLYLTFGLVSGFGLSLCYVAAIVIVAFYFERRRSLATGISVCGSGVGTFLFAPLTQALVDAYGWRGATAILAAVFLNMVVCGMLFRELEWTEARRRRRRRRTKRKRQKRMRLGRTEHFMEASFRCYFGDNVSFYSGQKAVEAEAAPPWTATAAGSVCLLPAAAVRSGLSDLLPTSCQRSVT